MNLIGVRFTTFRDEHALVKCEDLNVEGRLPVRCYREALAARLAQRLGLAIPVTDLVTHPRFGRIATRPWLVDARAPSTHELQSFCCAPSGLRILILDLLIANSDRRRDNVLLRRSDLVPIDHNVAFAFTDESRRTESPDVTIMRWFGVTGAIALAPGALDAIEHEITRFEHLVSEPYIHWAIAQIPTEFLPGQERGRLLQGLLTRRKCVRSWIHTWWRRSVAPIHRITEATDD